MAMDRAEVLGGQEPDSGRVPLALVRLNPRGTQWIIDQCPHCGKRHVHGARDGDPLDALGHRVGHCLNGGGPGYVLMWDAERADAAERRRVLSRGAAVPRRN